VRLLPPVELKVGAGNRSVTFAARKNQLPLAVSRERTERLFSFRLQIRAPQY
jgi:hypothetical protein